MPANFCRTQRGAGCRPRQGQVIWRSGRAPAPCRAKATTDAARGKSSRSWSVPMTQAFLERYRNKDSGPAGWKSCTSTWALPWDATPAKGLPSSSHGDHRLSQGECSCPPGPSLRSGCSVPARVLDLASYSPCRDSATMRWLTWTLGASMPPPVDARSCRSSERELRIPRLVEPHQPVQVLAQARVMLTVRFR